ncbi:MAG TPA: hypothetical protein PKJ99_02475 [Thermoanaerobaculales bacterium]|nr:hypothetical protein [Thermoanaerobaculales bacterium]
MRVRRVIGGDSFEVELTTNHRAATNGRPVLVLKHTGEALEPSEISGVELLITDLDELDALAAAGYGLTSPGSDGP